MNLDKDLFDEEETIFLRAIDKFKRDTGTKFPTWSQALKILKSLGYSREQQYVPEFGSEASEMT